MKLQNKFLGLLVPAGLLAGALVLFLIQRAVHAVILGGLQRSAVVLARSAAQEASPAFPKGKEAELLPPLQALQRRENALYAAALDPSGRILAHTNVTEKGRVDKDSATLAALDADEPVSWQTDGAEPALVVVAPVWAAEGAAGPDAFLLSGEMSRPDRRERRGALKVAVPLRASLDTESRIIREISLIVLLIGGIALGLVALLVRGILAPVRGLMSGIARVGTGDYEVQVPVMTADELGELAASFNRMSGELARTTVSKEYVEAVLENMADLLVVADPDGNIRTINRAAATALGREPGEMIGRPLAELFEGAGESLRAPGLGEAVLAGRIRDLEVSLRAKDGSRVPALLSASVLRDRSGRVTGIIAVAKDIAERKRAEEALVAAKSRAEASSRELEAFSYSVAHDLRAPLRAVDGFSQILLENYAGALDDKAKDYLARVRGGSRKMGQLIDDLLNLSRITRSTLKVETVNLSAMASEVAADLRKSQPERRVDFAIAPGLAARGDPNLLRVALVNLLGNAWKYTGKKPSARIEFGVERAGGEKVYFVRDDGAGFDMAFSARLFQPFTRLHAAAEFEGTGIGLATVQRVIERHQGRIWGEGAVGAGAVFRFTLWGGKS